MGEGQYGPDRSSARKNIVEGEQPVGRVARCAVRAERRESTVIRKSSRTIFSSLPTLADSPTLFANATPFPALGIPLSRRKETFRGNVERRRTSFSSINDAFPRAACFVRLVRGREWNASPRLFPVVLPDQTSLIARRAM